MTATWILLSYYSTNLNIKETHLIPKMAVQDSVIMSIFHPEEGERMREGRRNKEAIPTPTHPHLGMVLHRASPLKLHCPELSQIAIPSCKGTWEM